MSEATPPPPIPPTSMAPPPGYVGYQGTDFSQAGLRRLRGLAIAIVVLVGVYALASALGLAVISAVKDSSEDFLAERISAEDFDEDLAAYGLGGVLGGLANVAAVVVSMIWLYRMTSNHRTLGRAVFWAPLWAIFAWFLPPFLFIIPLLMLIEAWKAADPQSPAGSDTWKRGAIAPPIIVWFLIFGIARTIASFLTGSPFDQFSRDRDDMAERFVDHASGVAIQAIVEIASAAAWGWLVWSLTKRHTQLTGEASTR